MITFLWESGTKRPVVSSEERLPESFQDWGSVVVERFLREVLPFVGGSLLVSSQNPYWWTLPLAQEGCANIASIDYWVWRSEVRTLLLFTTKCVGRESHWLEMLCISWGLRWRRPEENCLKSLGTRAAESVGAVTPWEAGEDITGGPIAHIAIIPIWV